MHGNTWSPDPAVILHLVTTFSIILCCQIIPVIHSSHEFPVWMFNLTGHNIEVNTITSAFAEYVSQLTQQNITAVINQEIYKYY